jgi:ABC-2 type transport system ATP-binding protein
LISVVLGSPCPCDLSVYGTPVESENSEDGKQFVQVPAGEVAAITARMLADLPIHDLTIEDPPIENVIERAFEE